MDIQTKEKYADTYGCRFYAGQKKKFIEALNTELGALGLQSVAYNRKRFKLFNVNDYVFGNLKQAKTIFVIPYDTPEKCLWFKNTYYVNNGTKNQSAGLMQTFGPILIFYLLFVVLLYVLPQFVPGFQAQLLFTALCFLLMALILVALTKGFPNKKNYNRNSSGVIVAVELAKSLSRDDLKKTAFVFTDANKSVFMGDMILRDELSFMNRNPLVLHLNCVGDGDLIHIGYTPTNRKVANEFMKHYHGDTKIEICELKDENRQNCAMAHYKKAIQISAGVKNEKNFLVTNKTCSKKDVDLNESMIDGIVDMLKKYVSTSK